MRSAQEARSFRIRRQFIKIMPGWLRAKFLEHPDETTLEKLCIFARKHLWFHYLCKTDDFVIDEFSGMGPSDKGALVTTLTKLSTSQEALDNLKKFRQAKIYFDECISRFSEKSNTTTPEGLFFTKPWSKLKFLKSQSPGKLYGPIQRQELRIKRTSTELSTTSMAESEAESLCAATTVMSRTSAAKSKLLFFSRNLPVLKHKITTFEFKILGTKTHSLRIRIFNQYHCLKSLLQTPIT